MVKYLGMILLGLGLLLLIYMILVEGELGALPLGLSLLGLLLLIVSLINKKKV